MQSLEFFWTTRSAKYDLLQIYELFNVTNGRNLLNVVKEGIINFEYFYFNIKSYYL